MTYDEQQQRRALKRARRELDRNYSKGRVHYLGFDAMPSRMGVMRRIHHAGRNRDHAYRELRAAISAIDQQLRMVEA